VTPDRLRFVLILALVVGGSLLMATAASGVWAAVIAVVVVATCAVVGFRGTRLSRE
jgi:hypothetical protein